MKTNHSELKMNFRSPARAVRRQCLFQTRPHCFALTHYTLHLLQVFSSTTTPESKISTKLTSNDIWTISNTNVKWLHLYITRNDYRLRFQGPIKACKITEWAIQGSNEQVLLHSSISWQIPFSQSSSREARGGTYMSNSLLQWKDAIKSVNGEIRAGLR